VGNFHFVQLNYYPNYTTSFEGWSFDDAQMEHVNITASHSWLREDLKSASASGKKIILNVHSPGHLYDDHEFKEIAKNHPNIIAIFGGHVHDRFGRTGSLILDDKIRVGTTPASIPLYWSGNPGYSNYLLVNFKDDAIASVTPMSSEYGNATEKN
jgi:hypothetical protein